MYQHILVVLILLQIPTIALLGFADAEEVAKVDEMAQKTASDFIVLLIGKRATANV